MLVRLSAPKSQRFLRFAIAMPIKLSQGDFWGVQEGVPNEPFSATKSLVYFSPALNLSEPIFGKGMRRSTFQ